MDIRDYITSSDCKPLVEALYRAWPEASRIKIRASYDARPPHAIGAETWSDSLCVELTITGPEAWLLSAGLLTRDDIDAIPPCGSFNRVGFKINRNAESLRLNVCLRPGDDLGPRRQRVWDATARALMPAVWTPPKREDA